MSTIKIHGRIIPFRSMVNNHHNLPEAWWWFSTPKDLVDVLSKFHLDPPPPSPLPFRRAPRGGDGGTFGWMTSTNWAAQKKGGESYFFSMGELDSWWFWIWFFSMIFKKKSIACWMIDAFLLVGFETPLALLMHWLQKPTTKTHPLFRALSETRSTIWMGFMQASMLC